jgi:sugar transferase (PEP-CTERM/EpsH1 system associated)
VKLLFVVPYVPNQIRVRPYELLRTLARRGHTITLATLWQDPNEQADLAALRELGIEMIARPLPKWRSLWNSLQALPSRTPLQARYCWQPMLAQALREVVAQRTFDVVHVEHLRGAAYGLLLRDLPTPTGQRLPVVWDSVDCISHLFAQAARQSRSRSGRLMTALELPRTQRYEGWLLHQFAQVLVTSQADQQALLELTTEPPPTVPAVTPNGVDLSYFARPPAADPQATGPATIVFSGKMSYHANVTAALYLVNEIMPHVWATHPDVRVQIVGKDPPPAVRALGEANPARVEVTGTVPDLRPYLQKATIAAAPLLYGAGIQNKVLEAMACGAPVVTTAGAAGGMGAQPGRDLLVADDAQHFGATLVRLIENQDERRALADCGRAYVEHHHSWSAIVAELETIYEKSRGAVWQPAPVRATTPLTA